MFNAAFTDVQGMEHTNAVVRVRTVYRNTYSQKTMAIQSDGSYATNVSGGSQIVMTAEYWPTQALYNQNRKPYRLIGPDESESFTFSVEDNIADEIAACEAHLLAVVLPSLAGAPV